MRGPRRLRLDLMSLGRSFKNDILVDSPGNLDETRGLETHIPGRFPRPRHNARGVKRRGQWYGATVAKWYAKTGSPVRWANGDCRWQGARHFEGSRSIEGEESGGLFRWSLFGNKTRNEVRLNERIQAHSKWLNQRQHYQGTRSRAPRGEFCPRDRRWAGTRARRELRRESLFYLRQRRGKKCCVRD